MATVIDGVLRTPVDPETGQRKEIIISTTAKNVQVESQGKDLEEVLKAMTYTDATVTSSGLMTATQVQDLQNLQEQAFISSSGVPSQECLWLQELAVEEENPPVGG